MLGGACESSCCMREVATRRNDTSFKSANNEIITFIIGKHSCFDESTSDDSIAVRFALFSFQPEVYPHDKLAPSCFAGNIKHVKQGWISVLFGLLPQHGLRFVEVFGQITNNVFGECIVCLFFLRPEACVEFFDLRDGFHSRAVPPPSSG